MLGEVRGDSESERDRADHGDQEYRRLREMQRESADEMRMLAGRGDCLGQQRRRRRLQSTGGFAVGLRRVLICLTRHDDTFADASLRIKERSVRRMPQHNHCMRAVALIRERGNLPRKQKMA